MSFVTKKALSRRTLLRGAGAAIALPMLDSMVPALTAAAPIIPRLGWVYVSHGVIWSQWKPTTTGKGFALTPNLRRIR